MGSAVSKILWYKQTDRQADIILLCIIDIFYIHREARDVEINSGSEKQAPARQGKFLLYWMTTTSTTTSTTYTATATLLTLGCTPSGWTYSVCG